MTVHRLCKWCGSDKHAQTFCYKKPRKAIKRESTKTRTKRLTLRDEWLALNPPDARGEWTCYLNISPSCLKKVDESTLVLEHVRSKARAPQLKFKVANLRSSCEICNGRKLTLDLEDLVDEFPHLRQYM